jgi:kynureninase
MTLNDTFHTDEHFARRLDESDPLSLLRQRFHVPPGKIYMLVNSLGLMPKAAEAAVERVMAEWRDLGIDGWLRGNPPWFYLAERTGEAIAVLVGAAPDEVICTGTTTFNIHSLVSTLYRPAPGRTKVLASALDFPTDIYALKSQIALRGLDWRENLVLVGGDADGLVREEAIIDALAPEVALALLPSVFYRSGQLLDIERITAAAHERGITIGFDCSHSVGIVPHCFDEWGVDFALWCSYKYLCAGPGAPAFIYLARRHFDCEPGLAGWFGYVKERQFDMSLDFAHAPSAGGWQVSSPGILGAAAVAGALDVVREAGIERIREKSLHMTSYLMFLTDELLSGEPYRFRIATPREPRRRGGHVALARAEEALRIKEALEARGVVADFRPPDVIRLAPSPLYSTYHDIWMGVRHLREIIDTREYERIPLKRKPIS